MIAQDGRVVTNADLAGRPYLVFFGYTHCPDVCPTALFDISAVFKELGPGKRFSLPSLSHQVISPKRARCGPFGLSAVADGVSLFGSSKATPRFDLLRLLFILLCAFGQPTAGF